MTKPIVLPEWDETEVNSIEPDATHKSEGWLAPGGVPEKPPFQSFNFWQNSVWKWLNEINIKGLLGYDALTDYIADLSYTIGSDGNLYQCGINNGPSTSVVNPVGDLTGTWLKAFLKNDSLPGLAVKGNFIWKDANEIYINPFTYHHQGTTEQMVYCDSQLTYTFSSLAVSDWSYLYLDDSAIVTAGTNLIAAGQLIDSLTEPTWNAAKHGWYNGSDRCIFAVKTDGSSQIEKFYHDGGDLVKYDYGWPALASTDIDDTWTDVALLIPAFSTKATVHINGEYVDGESEIQARTNGSSGTGFGVSFLNQYMETAGGTPILITDDDQKIEVRMSASNGNLLIVSSTGFYLPTGM